MFWNCIALVDLVFGAVAQHHHHQHTLRLKKVVRLTTFAASSSSNGPALYDCPVCHIATNFHTTKNLDCALSPLCKCKLRSILHWLVTIVGAADFSTAKNVDYTLSLLCKCKHRSILRWFITVVGTADFCKVLNYLARSAMACVWFGGGAVAQHQTPTAPGQWPKLICKHVPHLLHEVFHHFLYLGCPLGVGKAVLNHTGYSPEISHRVLVDMAEHKKELEKKTKPILDTLRSYQDLPPDKALAALAIEDKKRQYAAAENYLENVLQSALAHSG